MRVTKYIFQQLGNNLHNHPLKIIDNYGPSTCQRLVINGKHPSPSQPAASPTCRGGPSSSPLPRPALASHQLPAWPAPSYDIFFWPSKPPPPPHPPTPNASSALRAPCPRSITTPRAPYLTPHAAQHGWDIAPTACWSDWPATARLEPNTTNDQSRLPLVITLIANLHLLSPTLTSPYPTDDATKMAQRLFLCQPQ